MADSDSIQWNDTMLTGVDEMDVQHHILVDTLIDANARLTDDANDPLFEQITRDLLAYAIYHFDTEEQLMMRYGYAAKAPEEAERHLNQHRRFSDRVVAMRNEARAGKPGSREALLTFLRDWLINHILTTDKELGRFVLSATAKP
ncbi:MAG: bacteriohemerythrin [Gammaproteobacteria bacterium]|nr:bacteriohemerythrin [Gammaproteobacteria bacterium]MBU1416761.1 bacteriohemerythrin [Gammaproteobacteria bacterium]